MSGNLATVPAVDKDLERRLTKAAKKVAQAPVERDQLIIEAYRRGAGLREIARVTDLTHPGVRDILIRKGVYDEKRGES